jgi:DNA polymerase-3 subunit epsilon
MVVTDGTVYGSKMAKASELDIRIVHPAQYATLLTHLQPAQSGRSLNGVTELAPRHLTRAVATSADADDAAAADGFSTAHASTGERMKASTVTLVAPTPAVVRAWGRENGWEVGVRGRLPRPLLDAYMVANANA